MDCQLKVPAALPPGRIPVHIAYEAVWAWGPVWTLWRIEKSLVFAGIGTLDRPAHGLVPVAAPVNR